MTWLNWVGMVKLSHRFSENRLGAHLRGKLILNQIIEPFEISIERLDHPKVFSSWWFHSSYQLLFSFFVRGCLGCPFLFVMGFRDIKPAIQRYQCLKKQISNWEIREMKLKSLKIPGRLDDLIYNDASQTI